MTAVRVSLMLALALASASGAASGQTPDSVGARTAPFVPGGYDDKPYLQGIFGRIAVGGYLEGNGQWEREDGATTELGFELTRSNLLLSTDIRGRVQIWSEIEFEEGGEEITVELAQVDLLLHSAANLRAGILLLPLGRFNLAHDGPRNPLPSRPPMASDLLGVALSQPGIGGFGRFAGPAGARLTYEIYGVTGFHAGLLEDSPEGTRLPAGRSNPEDANASPAWVGRVEWSLGGSALGLSGYHGAYNVYRSEGLELDERRDVSVGVVNFEAALMSVTWSGEGAWVGVDIPSSLDGIFASRQAGAYLQGVHEFGRGWIGAIPDSRFGAVLRADGVDFDRDVAGDSFRSLTVGVLFRPVDETAIKLALMRGESRDRFNNQGTVAQAQLGIATYF